MSSRNSDQFDWITASIYFSLLVIGALMLYATDHQTGNDLFEFTDSFRRQLTWLGISVFFFVLALVVDWKLWYTFAYPIMGVSILLLLIVLIVGVEVKGAKAWISLFGFSFQPAEFAKFGTCIALSSFLSTNRFNFNDVQSIMTSLGIILVPIGLILLQPDLGSALVFGSFFIMFYRNGLSTSYYILGFGIILVFIFSLIYSPIHVVLGLLICALIMFLAQLNNRLVWAGGMASAIVAALILFFQGYQFAAIVGLIGLLGVLSIYLFQIRKGQFGIMIAIGIIFLSGFSYGTNYSFNNFLKPHQKDRIRVWLQPEKTDPHGERYNLLQSQLAIGSGGLQGKGFLNGTMTKLNYVPMQNTDFIFSTIGEEQGFLGTVGVVFLFSILLVRIIQLAEKSRHKFVLNYGYGFAGILFFHYFINIGMTMGIMPIVGIPLPFISKGGSSLLIFSLMMGILLKMDSTRKGRY